MSSRRVLGVAGSLVLAVGVFTPLVSMPFVGSINYFRNGEGTGLAVLVLAAIALGLTLARRYKLLLPIAIVVLALLTFTFVGFQRVAADLRSSMAGLDTGFLAGAAQLMANSVQLQWGWAILVVGAGLLLGASLSQDTSEISGGRASKPAFSRLELAVYLPLALVVVGGAGAAGYMAVEQRSTSGPTSSTSGRSPSLDEDLAALKVQSARYDENAYLTSVKVTNVEVSQTMLDELGVFGEVTNHGTRSLDEVEITIYFLDAQGRAIHESDYHPVLVSEYGFGDANAPLKSGYSRKFGVRAGDAPSGWSRRVRVAVTDVEFSKP